MINKTILIGHITWGPELRVAKDGVTKFAKFGLVTEEFLGAGKKHAEFHKIVCFGRSYNACNTLFKGRKIYIEGRNRTRPFTNKEGVELKETSVHADIIEYLDHKKPEDFNKESVTDEVFQEVVQEVVDA